VRHRWGGGRWCSDGAEGSDRRQWRPAPEAQVAWDKRGKNEAHPKTSTTAAAASIPLALAVLRWWCRTGGKVEALWRVARLLSREIG
jgi:hypothetical protein